MAPPKWPALLGKTPDKYTEAPCNEVQLLLLQRSLCFMLRSIPRDFRKSLRSVRLFSPRDQCCLHRMAYVAHVHETQCNIQLQVNNSE